MSSFKESLSPILWAYRLVGLTVFEMPKNVNWPKSSVAYVTTLTLTYSYVLWCKFDMGIDPSKLLPLVTVIFRMNLILNIVAAAGSSIVFWFNLRNHGEYIRRVILVDETLQSFGIDPQYKQEYRENLIILLLCLLAIILLFVSGILVHSRICDTVYEVLIHTVSFFWPQVLNHFIDLSFSNRLLRLYKRFKRVNALIYNIVVNTSKTATPQGIDKYHEILMNNQHYDALIAKYYENNRDNLELVLAATRQLHLDLCSISRLLNRISGPQLAMQFAVKFSLITGYGYSLYLLYKEDDLLFSIKISLCFYVVIRIAYAIIRFFILIIASETVAAEARKTSQMIQEIEDPREKIGHEIQEFSMQIMNHPLNFTACGLYTLDFNFVQSFAGSVAFYLVILIQNQPAIKKTADDIIIEETISSKI